MQPFPSELEPPEADRALETIAAGTDNGPASDRPLAVASRPAPQPHQFERGQLHDQLEMLGVLVDRRLLDFDLVLACFHQSPPMVWAAIEPYIRTRRTLASPLEGQNFEELVTRYRESSALQAQYWDRSNVL